MPDRVHLLARIRGYTLIMRCGEKRRSPGGIRYVDRRTAFEAWPSGERCPECAAAIGVK